MSKLDQAFIRAFAQPSAASAATAQPARPRTASPAFNFKATEALPIAEPIRPVETNAPQSATRPAVEFPPSRPLAPLSQFTPTAPVQDACRALLEVDRLVWPPACNELMLRAASELERFTQQLVDRTSRGEKCIGITSSQRGEGRTTVCLTTARLLADRGLRVVIVDVDVECPALVRMCGISAATGWNDLLNSELPLGEALITAITDRVTLMPWRGPAASLADLAATGRAATVFGTLRDHYDLILIDTTPLDQAQVIHDFSLFAASVQLDAMYVVQDVRVTPRQQLNECWLALRQARLPVVAAIENFVGEHAAERYVMAELATNDRGPLTLHE